MDELDWFHVAPNRPQNLHVKVHRLRLGNPTFEGYPHQQARAGFFAVWIPPLGGDLTIELEHGATATIRLFSGDALVRKEHGTRLVHRISPSTMGRFDIHVSRAEVGVRASLTMETWPLEADGTPLVPWNFWYFPYGRVPLAADADRREFPSHDVQFSAMRKYDRAFPPPPGANSAEAWEREFHSSGAEWEGHCDPGAYASVYFQQPRETVPRGDVVFTRHELELLATEWTGARMGTVRGWHHGEARGDPAFRLSGPVAFATHLLMPGEKPTAELLRTRYEKMLPDAIARDREVVIQQEASRIAADPGAVRSTFGRAAHTFWTFLMAEAHGAREPIVGDVGPGGDDPAPVWNHAVAMVRLAVAELEGPRPDPRRVAATVELVVNLDKEPLAPRRPSPEPDPADGCPVVVQRGRPVPISGFHQTHDYGFRFRFETDGQLADAEWTSAHMTQSGKRGPAYAPRRFGIPARPRPVATSGNHHGRTPPANTLVGDGILQLVTLRPRYT